MSERVNAREMYKTISKNLGLPVEGRTPDDPAGSASRVRNPLAAYMPVNWSNASSSHFLRGGTSSYGRSDTPDESNAMVMPEIDVLGPKDALTRRCDIAIAQLAEWRAEDPYSEPITTGDALLSVWAVVDQFYGKGIITEREVAERRAKEMDMVEVTPRSVHEAEVWEKLGWDVVLAEDPGDASTWHTIQVKNSLDDSADKEKAKKSADELVVEN